MGKPSRRKVQRHDRFDLTDFEPVRMGPDTADDEVEQIHAFSIGDIDYYVPVAVPFHHSMKAMELYATRGEAAAVAYTLRTVLGDEAYNALLDYKGLTEGNFKAVVELANRIVNASAGKAP